MRTLQINLLPEKKKKFKMPSIPILPIFFLLILGAGSYYLFVIQKGILDEKLEEKNQIVARKRQEMKTRISNKQDKLNKIQREVSDARKKVEKLKSLTGIDKLPWSKVLSELSKIVPEDLVWIKSFSYDQTGRVSMNCVGKPIDKEGTQKLDDTKKIRDYGSIEKFINAIKDNRYFKKPFCSNASVGKMFNNTIVNFSMSCKIDKNLTTLTNMGGN